MFRACTENDVTVTILMRVFVNGREEPLPSDWRLHVVTEGDRTRVTVERAGEFMSLSRALALRDVLKTSSWSETRRA